MREKKVSVFLTTYNHEQFIADAVASVLMQETDFDYEIIILEDYSTDETREIVIDLRRHYPEKIRLVLSARNLNDNTTWRREIPRTQSRYVALLDGDDYWVSPSKLQKQVQFLDAHPECSICFHNAVVLDEDSTKPASVFNSARQKPISTLEDLWSANFIAGCAAMLRRTALEQIPEWYDHAKWGDWPLYILAAQNGKIGFVNEVMAVYRVHRGGFWSGLSETQQIEGIIEFYNQMNVFLDFKYEETIKSMIGKYYHRLAIAYEKIGEIDAAKACIQRSLVEGC